MAFKRYILASGNGVINSDGSKQVSHRTKTRDLYGYAELESIMADFSCNPRLDLAIFSGTNISDGHRKSNHYDKK